VILAGARKGKMFVLLVEELKFSEVDGVEDG
jgi:hypothetical protein